MYHTKTDLEFRYRLILKGGSTDLGTVFGNKGVATADGLKLGKDFLAYEHILETAVQDRQLVLALSPGCQLSKKLHRSLVSNNCLALEVRKAAPREVGMYISRCRSKREVENHRAELTAAGKIDLFRAADCPHCGATVDLSGFDLTHYVHCRYCETVFDKNGQVSTRGEKFSICDECGLFDRLRVYTESYFYFLLAVWGYRAERKFVCDACAGRIFLKTFFLNLPFLLGVPNSIAIKLKSMSQRTEVTRLLAEANSNVRKGRYQQVAMLYQNVYLRYPNHPGLLMNEAFAYANGGNLNGCESKLRESLRACANFLPAFQLLEEVGVQNIPRHGLKQKAPVPGARARIRPPSRRFDSAETGAWWGTTVSPPAPRTSASREQAAPASKSVGSGRRRGGPQRYPPR